MKQQGNRIPSSSGGAKWDDTISIQLVVDRFEEGKAVLVGERGVEIITPKRLIPKTCNEGDVIHLTFASDEAETSRREQTAKELLNEILKS